VLEPSSAAVVLAAKNSGGSALSLLFPVILVLGFYLLFMRPARQRQRKAAETRTNVAPGVEVVTTAGLIATVVDSDDETVTLEIAPGVHSKFLKQAIARVVLPPQSPDEVEPSDEVESPDAPGAHEQIEPDTTDGTPPASQG
jgi:preprotein translocase subunit YajC